MMKRTPWPQLMEEYRKRREAIVEDYEQGMTQNELAEKYEVTQAQIHRLIKKQRQAYKRQ